MKHTKTFLLLGLALVSAAAVFAVGCGGPDEGASETREPTAALFPTMTPQPPFPGVSSVTLEPAGEPADDGYLPDGIYVADALTGEVYKVVTPAGPTLEPDQWLSPTQLILNAWGPTDQNFYLLDLDAKTLRRLAASAGTSAVSFSHSGGLMTNSGPAGEIVISSVADGREIARVAIDSASTSHGSPYVSWAPDDKHIFFRSGDGPGGMIISVEANPTVIPITAWNDLPAPPWLPDGSGIVMGDSDSLYSVDVATGETTRLYAWGADGAKTPGQPSISPDGRYAFATTGTGPGRPADVVPLDGSSGGFEISSVEPLDTAWSTTQDVLAVIADRCTGGSRLLLVAPDGSVPAIFDDGSFIPRFSANGQMLAYMGGYPAKAGVGNEWGIVVRSATGNHDIVSFIPHFFDDTVWSPDGRWFADSTGNVPAPYSNSCVSGMPKTEISPLP